jgi:hypothetical protein
MPVIDSMAFMPPRAGGRYRRGTISDVTVKRSGIAAIEKLAIVLPAKAMSMTAARETMMLPMHTARQASRRGPFRPQ